MNNMSEGLARSSLTHKPLRNCRNTFFLFIQLWRIPLQKRKIKRNMERNFFYLNHADDLKNREKVKVIFFSLNEIEAWLFLLLTLFSFS